MKKVKVQWVLWMLLGIGCLPLHAQIDNIRIQESKIFDNSLFSALTYLKKNQSYCDHWTQNWNYPIKKEELLHGLRGQYSVMMGYDSLDPELQLMMGLTAHYLYNLDDTLYYNVAIRHFKEAITLLDDGRGEWMLGNHYSLAGSFVEGFGMMDRAKQKLSSQDLVHFWDDYAMASAMANMPSHSIMGMEEYKKINHQPSYFESQLGNAIRKRIVPVDADSIYAKEQIWFLQRSGSQDEYTCNPVGIRFLVDTSCKVVVYDYSKRQNVLLLQPASFFNKQGRAINMSMLMLMHPAKKEEALNTTMKRMTADKWKSITETSWDSKYGKVSAWEIKEPTLYTEMGGGHLWLVGLEREEPEYPGMLLERPSQPDPYDGSVSIAHPNETIGRFKGKIQYLFLLDTCEAIYEPSLAFFKKFIDEQLILE